MLQRFLRCQTEKHQYLWKATPLRNYALPSPRASKARSSKQTNLNATSKTSELLAVPRWPTDVFTAAYQDHILNMPPANVHHFLDKIWDLANTRKLNRVNVETALSERMLKIEDLTTIAKLLTMQRSDVRLISIGLDCLSLASDLGDDNAPIILVDIAIENKAHQGIGTMRYQKALAHIKKLAATKNLHPMVSLAKAYEHSENFREAANVYREVIETNNSKLQANEPVFEEERTPLAEAYRNMGRLALHSSGSEKSSFRNFEVAALEYEDAISFYYMALMLGDSHKDYIRLLSQAAISGVTEAAYELGLAYAREGDTLGHLEKCSQTTYSMAAHWFELAQDVPKMDGRARLHIARLRRVQGDPTAPGIDEIERIVNEPGIGFNPQVQRFIVTRWEDPSLSLTAGELESKMEDV